MDGVAEQVREHWGRSRHVGRALKRRVLGTINPLLRLHYFVFDGEQNYEIDFLQVLAFQLKEIWCNLVHRKLGTNALCELTVPKMPSGNDTISNDCEMLID